MSGFTPMEGGCNCGALRYRLTREPMFVNCCHCLDCQRHTGGGFVINMIIEGACVERLQGTPVGFPVKREAGPHTIFRCPDCQTAVWSVYGKSDKVLFVRAGTLDEPSRVRPGAFIYTRSRLPWLQLPPDIPAFTEYYDTDTLWSAESNARRKALFGN